MSEQVGSSGNNEKDRILLVTKTCGRCNETFTGEAVAGLLDRIGRFVCFPCVAEAVLDGP